MVSSAQPDGLIYNVKLSSVGPGNVTGQDAVYEPSNADLAMKLHYLRGVYYFDSQAFEGLNVLQIKEPLFTLLNQYYVVCGRFRRAESGRPYIKCNDCGVRFIEACCHKTLQEWVDLNVDASLEKLLTPNQVISPELFFSPSVLMQYTKFRCGGVSFGLSWSHVLGDVSSAAEFMNMFGKVIAGAKPERPVTLAQSLTKETPHQDLQKPLSIKEVGPVGDHWTPTSSCKLESFSFFVTASQLSHIRSTVGDYSPFELLSSIVWQSVARNRKGSEPKVVTVCKKGAESRKDGSVSNSQVISVVKVGSPVREANLSELARLLKHEGVDEGGKIDEEVEKEGGSSDFVLYGANLTLVNMEDVNFYEFQWGGHKPVNVSFHIDGVGDEGCVLVHPGPRQDGEGRVVRVVLPENEVKVLKSELRKEWSIV